MEKEYPATVCWECCEVYQQFKEGGRLKEEDLCPTCPIRDFQGILKLLTMDTLFDEPSDKDICSTNRCSMCDFKDLTRFEEPCYSCNKTMRRRMIAQNQIKVFD